MNVIFLGYLGAKPAEGIYVTLGLIATFYYFAYFLLILPYLSKYEKFLPIPESIDEHYKQKHKK